MIYSIEITVVLCAKSQLRLQMVKSFEFDTFYKDQLASKTEIYLLEMTTLLSFAYSSTAFASAAYREVHARE